MQKQAMKSIAPLGLKVAAKAAPIINSVMSLCKSTGLVVASLITGCIAGDELAGNATCAPSLQVIEVSPPELPPRLHNEFEGVAEVQFWVNDSGHISDPNVIYSEWNPIGNARGEPIGYDEAILKAATKLIFEPPSSGCLFSYRYSIRWQS